VISCFTKYYGFATAMASCALEYEPPLKRTSGNERSNYVLLNKQTGLVTTPNKNCRQRENQSRKMTEAAKYV
jgi:hypothetical protein